MEALGKEIRSWAKFPPYTRGGRRGSVADNCLTVKLLATQQLNTQDTIGLTYVSSHHAQEEEEEEGQCQITVKQQNP